MLQEIAIVNASPIMRDDEFPPIVAALQTQIDRDFMPAWSNIRAGARSAKLTFYPWSRFPEVPPEAWPIFVNRHSIDPGALAWHTEEGKRIYGRVFAGDCRLYNLSFSVSLGHEILEMMADPEAKKVYGLPDGRSAAFEVCDPVEADEQAYEIDGIMVPNFVLPLYFSSGQEGAKYDFRGNLSAPCPELTAGGYQMISEAGSWQQLNRDHATGLLGRRAVSRGFRRIQRHSI